MLCRRFLRVLIFILLHVSLASARDLALVSNKSNAIGELTVPELVKLCKAQTQHWPDGKPVTFIMRSPDLPEMQMVLGKVYGMSGKELDSLIVTSRRERPAHPALLVAASDDELVDKVASTPGAIGVVDVYSINGSVAVLKIAGKLPLQPGYFLHGN